MADYAGDKSKVGGIEGMKNALEYITDAEKVITKESDVGTMEVVDPINLELGPETAGDGNANRVLNYMSNTDKIKGKYISGYLCDPDIAISEFNTCREITLKRLNRPVSKETGAVAFHMVQSFPEGLSITDEEVHQCGIELCEKINAHQAVVCSHVHPVIDEEGEEHGKSKHNHILFNAYIHPTKLDPKRPDVAKYNDCKETYAQLRVWNDEIAINHGLPIIRNPDDDRVYSWKEKDEANKGRSWKQRVRLDIEDARRATTSWEEFVKELESTGYKIKDGTSTVTYITPDGNKVRGKTLGRQYDKANLNRYWEFRNITLKESDLEVENNATPPLLDTVLTYSGKLNAAVPIGMKSLGPRNYLYLPLEFIKQSNDILSTYFNENELYDICDEKNRNVCSATGKEIIECMETLREGRQHVQHGRENPELDQEDAWRRAAERREKERYYTYVVFVNSRSKKPYRASLYDEYGHRRSTLELMLLLAVTVLRKEVGLWDVDEVPTGKENDPIYAPRAWKLQSMIDSIYTARDEGIETPAELKRRLNEAGAAFSRAKSALKKTTVSKGKMEALNEAVKEYRRTEKLAQEILAMPEGPEKEKLMSEYKDVIDRYMAAKAVLYQYQVTTEDQIVDFEQRYKKISADIKDLESRLDETKEDYRRLKKLSYNVELAQNAQYCYGPKYTYEELYHQENIRETDEERNKREVQQVLEDAREIEDALDKSNEENKKDFSKPLAKH